MKPTRHHQVGKSTTQNVEVGRNGSAQNKWVFFVDLVLNCAHGGCALEK